MSRVNHLLATSLPRGSWVSAQFAALEAARLTSSAEPDALTPVVMSGGAEPAGAAKYPEIHADR